jgi:isoleucyl-tRNA synthetase
VIPFLTEEIYQNLVRSIFPEARESIHHTLWPEADQEVIDQKLIDQMKLARETASQGLSARSNAGLKVRQPLSQVLVYVKQGQAELEPDLLEIVKDELNIKKLVFVEDPESLLSYKILPDNKLLGPKYGPDFPQVKKALSVVDPDQVATLVNNGEPVLLEVEGKTITLEPAEVLVGTEAAEGLSTVDSKLLTVAIETAITPALREEGLARELVRRIQDFRKQADFDIADRISVVYQVSEGLKSALDSHRAYIMDETLALEMEEGESQEGMFSGTVQFEGEEATLGLKVLK